MKNEITELLKARINFMWGQTTEEQRTERTATEAAAALKFAVKIWTATKGLYTPGRESEAETQFARDGLLKMFQADYLNTQGRTFYILKDARAAIDSAPLLRRLIRDEMAEGRRRALDNSKAFFFIDTEASPATIPGMMTVEIPLPGPEEIAAMLDATARAAGADSEAAKQMTTDREEITAALTGLTSDQIRNAITRTRATNPAGLLAPATLRTEKKNLITSEAVTWIEPDPDGLANIGGLDILKNDLMKAAATFTPEARRWGLKAAKGALAVGIPGTGKSATARAVAATFKMPLLRLELAAMFSKFLGDSEKTLREALKTAAAVAAGAGCVLWIDEIEKGLAGAANSGANDGGTATRLFGALLTFAQEQEGIYLFATANNAEALPPELKRAGRFDAIYFLDVPNATERREIARIMGRRFPHSAAVNADTIAENSRGMTGAEIEEAYKKAEAAAYLDGQREATTADVLAALRDIVPIATLEAATLNKARKWAAGAARRASTPDTEQTATDTEAADFATL